MTTHQRLDILDVTRLIGRLECRRLDGDHRPQQNENGKNGKEDDPCVTCPHAATFEAPGELYR